MLSHNTPSRALFALWFTLSQIVAGVAPAMAQSGDRDLFADVDPPLIEHEVSDPVEPADRQVFTASVVDDEELDAVRLFYRFENRPTYESITMTQVLSSSSYYAEVETDPEDGSNIEYYIQARDLSGNRTVRGYAFSPLVRDIIDPVVAAEPAVEAPVAVVEEEQPSGSKSKILYYVLGALALGLLAGAAGGSGGGGEDSGGVAMPGTGCVGSTCEISITVNQPATP